MNAKEKIVICLDLSSELSEKDLRSSEGGFYERLFHIKRAIRMFVNLKSQMNFKHEYALMILQETAVWLEDFTNDPNEFVERLEYLNQTVNCSSADLNSVFDVIMQSVKLPEIRDERESFRSQDDDFVLRIVIFYGRSNCVPHFNRLNQSFVKLASNPNVFIDALYVHDVANSDLIMQTNLKLCELDVNEKSYILNTVWRLAKIYNDFSQLLAHPLQRVTQSQVNYNLSNEELNKINNNHNENDQDQELPVEEMDTSVPKSTVSAEQDETTNL